METKRPSSRIDHTLLGEDSVNVRALLLGRGTTLVGNAVSPQILAVLDGLPVLVCAMDLRDRVCPAPPVPRLQQR